MSRKKLQFDSSGPRNSQYQTDYLHHSSSKILTRKAIDTIKNPNRPTSKRSDYDRQDRERRLEKRMQLKEDMYGVQGRRRARRTIDDDESEGEYYSDEDSAEISQRAGTKRTRAVEAKDRPKKRQRID